jgi:hypothetical protein
MEPNNPAMDKWCNGFSMSFLINYMNSLTVAIALSELHLILDPKPKGI